MDISLLDQLPEDMIRVIGDFLPIQTRIWLSRKEYVQYRCTIGIPYSFDSYIRRVIRNDYDFILQIQFNKNYKTWRKGNPWYYKNYTLPSYLDYLNFLCIEHESQKCRKIVKEKRKRKHKKIRIRNNNTWSN